MECTKCFEAEMEERLVEGIDGIGPVKGMVCSKCEEVVFTHNQSIAIDNKRMYKRMVELQKENESLRVDLTALKAVEAMMVKEMTNMSGGINKKHFRWHVAQNCLNGLLACTLDHGDVKEVTGDRLPARVEQAVRYADLLIARLELDDIEKSHEVSAE